MSLLIIIMIKKGFAFLFLITTHMSCRFAVEMVTKRCFNIEVGCNFYMYVNLIDLGSGSYSNKHVQSISSYNEKMFASNFKTDNVIASNVTTPSVMSDSTFKKLFVVVKKGVSYEHLMSCSPKQTTFCTTQREKFLSLNANDQKIKKLNGGINKSCPTPILNISKVKQSGYSEFMSFKSEGLSYNCIYDMPDIECDQVTLNYVENSFKLFELVVPKEAGDKLKENSYATVAHGNSINNDNSYSHAEEGNDQQGESQEPSPQKFNEEVDEFDLEDLRVCI